MRYPAIGASLGKELGLPSDSFPNYVSIAPYQAINPAAFGPGFLGPRFGPLTVASGSRYRPRGTDAGTTYADCASTTSRRQAT